MTPSPSNPFARRLRFWHRSDEVRRQLQALCDGRPSFVIAGDERSGKSEFLGLVTQDVELSGLQVLTSYVDAIVWTAETPAEHLTSHEFWSSALSPLFALDDPSLQSLLASAAARRFSSGTLEPLSRELHRRGMAVLVQIDHFDALLLTPLTDLRVFLSTLRKLAGLPRQGIILALASYHRIEELNRKTEAMCAGSPFFNVFDEIVLGPLPEEGVNHILELAEDRFSAADRAFIRRAVGGHPELLWRASERMWEACVKSVPPHVRAIQVGRELTFAAGPLLRTTWERWSSEARRVVLRGLLASLRPSSTPLEAKRREHSAQGAPPGSVLLCDRLCELMGDQATLLRQVARLDGRLIFELPGSSVPLRQLVDATVDLLNRRGVLEQALALWAADPWGAGLRGAEHGSERGLLPATIEHLRRTGWIEVGEPRGQTSIRIGLLAWWLMEGLAPVARGELPLHRWLQSYQLDPVPASLLDELDLCIVSGRERLLLGSLSWLSGVNQ